MIELAPGTRSALNRLSIRSENKSIPLAIIFQWLISFVGIFGAICYFLYYLQYDIYDYLITQTALKQEAVGRVMEVIPLLFIVVVGVFVTIFNTVIYLISMICNATAHKKLTAFWSILCILCLVCVIGTVALRYSEIRTLINLDKSSDSLLNSLLEKFFSATREMDFISLVVFFLLLLIYFFDLRRIRSLLFNLEECSKINADQDQYKYKKKKLNIDRNSALLQLHFIDLPVIIGILLFNFYFKVSVDHSMVDTNNNQVLTLESFSAGITGMQIIYSQIVFLISMTFCYFAHQRNNRVYDSLKKSQNMSNAVIVKNATS